MEQHRTSNFWFGFSLGLTAATVSSYFILTKKGREMLKSLLEFAEHIEDHVDKLLREDKPVQRSTSSQKVYVKESPSEVSVMDKIRVVADN